MPPITFVSACLNPAPDGTRCRSAKILISMLARKGPLPPDAVNAAITLLTKDVGGANGNKELRLLEECVDGWRVQLEAPARSMNFAIKVLLAWNDCCATPSWDINHTDSLGSSLWRCITKRREAEDTQPTLTEADVTVALLYAKHRAEIDHVYYEADRLARAARP
jgi:hypothetical protein